MSAPRPGAILGALGGVVLLRVMGVSLLFAGFAQHGLALGGGTAEAGIAFGAYPLALALFMFPLASLSDRVGRRPVMVGALLVSAAGGIAAAFATDVVALTAARFVQGMGAVNGVALALAGETGDPARRTGRMAVLGAAAGIGFALGILLGAWLTPLVGVPWLLGGHAIATLATLPWIAAAIPAGRPALPLAPARPDVRVLALGGAAFAVNLALTGLLFLSPFLVEGISYAAGITLMVLPGGLGMFLAARLADRGHARAVGIAGALLLGATPLAFLWGAGVLTLVLAGILFFVGHSSLTSLLPSLAAASAAAGRRGHAQGIQSTLQYLGSFVGAALVGALWPQAGPLAALFLAAGGIVALAIVWATRTAREASPQA